MAKRISDGEDSKKKLLSLIDEEGDINQGDINTADNNEQGVKAENKPKKKVKKKEPLLGDSSPVTTGYRLMPVESLPSKGHFYPEGTTIEFRAATVNEIKTYSAMDKEDPISVRKGISSITTKCIQIKVDGKIISSQRLKAADELFMLFAIRDYTMTKNGRENGISMTSACPECGNNNNSLVTHEDFGFYDIPDSVMKWYDSDARGFTIQDDDVCPDPITIRIPNVGVVNAITDYIKVKETKKARNEDGAFYSKEYLQLIQYILKDHSNLTESVMDKKLKKIDKLPYYHISVLQNISDLLENAINPNYVTKCGRGGCDHVYDAPMRFRRHIKYLFDISGVTSKLF